MCVCELVSRLSLLYENTPVFSGLKVARFSIRLLGTSMFEKTNAS